MSTVLKSEFDKLSNRLQNGELEEQHNALAELRDLLEEAFVLYDKYHNLGRDWTKETVSDK